MKLNKKNKIPYAVFSGLVGTSLAVGAGNLSAKTVDDIQLSSNHQVIEKMLMRAAEEDSIESDNIGYPDLIPPDSE